MTYWKFRKPNSLRAPGPSRDWLDLSTLLVRCVGLGWIALSLLVMAGWISESVALTQGVPGFPSTKFNSALCLMLLGIAAWSGFGRGDAPLPYRVTFGLCALTLTLIGVILLQYPLERSLGIDEWLVRDPYSPEDAWPGRIRPAAGLGLGLVALACMLGAHPNQTPLKNRLLCLIAILTAWIGLQALIQIPLHLISGLPIDSPLNFGLYTALALLAMGSVLFLRGLASPLQNRHQRLFWLPLLAFMITLSIPVHLAKMLSDQQFAQDRQATHIASERIVTNIRRGVDQPVLALRRMAERAPIYMQRMQREAWAEDARHHLRDFPALRTIAMVGPDHAVLKQAPDSELVGPGSRLDFEPVRRDASERAFAKRGPQLSSAIELFEGFLGTVIVVPVFRSEQHLGSILASAQFTHLLETALEGVAGNYEVRVLEGERQIFGRISAVPQAPSALLVQSTLDLHGARWQVDVWPGAGAPGSAPSPLPSMVLIAGALTALLIALVLRMALVARWQRRAAEKSFASAQRAEEAMRASHERFEAVAHATSDAIWDWDLISNTIWWSESFETLFGFMRSQLERTSSSWTSRIHPDDRKRVTTGIYGAIERGDSHWRDEYRFALASGGWADVSDRGMIIHEGGRADGRAVRMVGGMSDITARKATERALRDRDRFFEVSLELLTIATPAGAVLQVNPAFEKVLGWSRDEILATPFLQFIHPDDVPISRGVMLRLAKGEAVGSFENRCRCKSGGYRWIQWSVAPSADGLLYAAGRDVTTRLDAESNLRQVVHRLEANNRELQEFSYIAARDLQEPLRRVRSYLSRHVLNRVDAGLDPDTRKAISRVEGATARMQTLVSGLMTYSRIINEGRPLAPVDLNATLALIVDELADQIRRSGGRVEVGDLPSILADQAQMRQLFLHLIGTGLKSNRAGIAPLVRISASAIDQSLESATPMTRILVEDRGGGFNDKPRDRPDGQDEYEGSGIGLAIVRRIVGRHHGTITAHSDARSGTRFEICLPSAGTDEAGASASSTGGPS